MVQKGTGMLSGGSSMVHKSSISSSCDPYPDGPVVSRAQALAWYIYLALGLGVTLGYFLLPISAVQDLWYAAFTCITCVALLIGICLQRPSNAAPWYLL